MDLVSIVVPIYKVEKYLQECIDSIVNQSYKNLQIILVDDGSPDRCGEICDKAAEKDNRIEVLHCENGGLSAARNRGMQICNGKYIYFVDSDDFLEKNAVSVLYEAAEKENLEIVLYDAISFDETTKGDLPEDEINKYIRKKRYNKVYCGTEIFIEMVEQDDYRSPVQYCFYNKKFIEKNSLSFHEGILHEDEEFNFFALMFADRVRHIPDVLYHHRFRANSIMSESISRKNTDSIFAILEKVIEKCDLFLYKSNTEKAYKLGLARFIRIYFHMIKFSCDRNSQETTSQIKALKKEVKKVRYFNDLQIKNAVRYGLRKPITVKAVKIKIYPYVKFLMGR